MHPSNPLTIAAFMAFSLAACGTSEAPPLTDSAPPIPASPPPQSTMLPDAEKVQFILIGDQGTQDLTQRDLANTVESVCSARGCDFAIALGDNIYNLGALLGVNDPQFLTAFESPYSNLDFPFFLTLGNHDNGATGHAVLFGDYEVQYHYKANRPSEKWQMPGRYYSQAFGANLLEIFSIDGDTITTNGELGDLRLGPDVLYDGREQRRWLHDSIRASAARWKIVFGHYQYSSNGNYGDGSADFKAALEEAMCDEAQFYFHGHEHDLRWMLPQATCGRTEFIVSGAGGRAEVRPAQNLGHPEYFNYRATAGFAWIEIEGDRFTALFYGTDPATPVFERSVTLSELGW
jgi:tartrate-resistant acid phosphatase type 5